ncbi:MAG: helix-turn-helix domain-containing protein [Vagococcus sp.]|jgi:Rgg/GadR/MutR family transcriptional activator|nr:helix-turn-helix domain-containing protein [Vagococcus sp.]
MDFGPSIRDIRLKKGYSQKEIYQDIMSKSYAIEFEKGSHNISSYLLMEILNRLSLDLEEFLFIYNNYSLNTYSDYIYKLSKFSNAHDEENLRDLLASLANQSDSISQVRCAEIRCRITMIQQIKRYDSFSLADFSLSDQSLIQNHLLNIETWTLQEIQLFGNTIEFLPFDKHFPLFKSLSKSLNLYIAYDKGREIFCSMLINLISQAIKHNYLDYATALNLDLLALSTDYKEFFHHTVATYLQCVLLYKQTNDKEKMNDAQELLSFISKLGQPSLATELSLLLSA